MTGDLAQLFITFVNPILLIMSIVLLLSMIKRSGKDVGHRDLLFGSVFAAAVLYSMSEPIQLGASGIFDMRGLLIGTAVALLGPKVGLIALGTGLIYRWSIGNPGMIPGFGSMFIAFGAGLVWRQFIASRNFAFWMRALSLAVLISFQTLAIFLADKAYWTSLFLSLAPYTIACNLLGSFLILYLFENEIQFLSQKEGLKLAAATDHLTGLQNRRGLEMQFSNLLGKRHEKRGVAAIYLDIDHFKQINDTYGHNAGDAVLQAVSCRLSNIFRPHDIVSRLGGDEFVVILPDVTSSEAQAMAERCRVGIAEKPIVEIDVEVNATVSIGVVWTKQSNSFARILHIADQALYEAKARGRNVVAFRSWGTLGEETSKPLVA